MVRIVCGYANVFNSVGNGPTGKEIFLPKSFRAALARGDDIRLVKNHEWAWRLASTAARTLCVEEDDHGLRFFADLPDTCLVDWVLPELRSGALWGCSIGFTTKWKRNGEFDGVRVVEQLEVERLYEITITHRPAFRSTWCSLIETADVAHADRLMRLEFAERSLR